MTLVIIRIDFSDRKIEKKNTTADVYRVQFSVLLCIRIFFFFLFSGPASLGFHNDDVVLNVIQTASLRKLNGSRVGKAPNLKCRQRPFFPFVRLVPRISEFMSFSSARMKYKHQS